MKRAALGLTAVALGAALALAVRPAGGPPPPPPAPPPVVRTDPAVRPSVPASGTSLLLVTWDTVRADRVSAYGHAVPTTPAFDALAAEGLLFERFVVPQATTLPTHLSLFTGLHPEEHGVLANSREGRRYLLSDRIVPLASHLGERGWWTGGFVSSTPLKQGSGAERGFQAWSQPTGKEVRAEHTVDAALAWLAEVPPDAPFLLWVHLVDPHFPWDVPPGYAEVLPPEPAAEGWLLARGMEASPRLLGRLKAYDAEIRYTDDQTARLLAALDAAGRRGDTAVVIAGDHGEGLGQHGHKEHGGVWHEQLASVLAVRAPGLPPGRVSTATTAEDLVPTLVPLVDWPDEERLLAPMSGMDALRAPPDRRVHARRSDRPARQRERGTPIWAVTDGRHAVLISEYAQATFDLGLDPHQRTPRADPEREAAWLGELERSRQRWAARATELGAGGTAELDAALKAELEALGYVE